MNVALLMDESCSYEASFLASAFSGSDLVNLSIVLLDSGQGYKLARRKFRIRRSFSFYVFKGLILLERAFGQHRRQVRQRIMPLDYRELSSCYGLKYQVVEATPVGPYRLKLENAAVPESIDIFVRCNQQILTGSVLEREIYSVHGGSPDDFRGGPAGFWEVYFGTGITEFIIQDLSERLDRGAIIFRGGIATKNNFSANRAAILKRSSLALVTVIKRRAAADASPQTLADGGTNGEAYFGFDKVYRAPTWVEVCIYSAKVYGSRMVARYWKAICFKAASLGCMGPNRQVWQILYGPADRPLLSPLSRADNLACLRKGFVADPFLVQHNDKLLLFYEFWCAKARKGEIHTAEFCWDSEKFIRQRCVMSRQHHISFPFVFSYEDQLLLLPEESMSGRLSLYRYDDKTGAVEWLREILPDVAYADPVIFRSEHGWELLVTLDWGDIGDLTTALFHFRCVGDLLTGTFVKQSEYPVNTDVRFGRNGGLISEGRRVLRVGQSSRFGDYGTGICLTDITFDDEGKLRETALESSDTLFRPQIVGIHTLSTAAGKVAIDVRLRG